MKYLLKSRYLLNVETLLYVYGFSSHGGLLSWIAQASAGVWYIVENALTCYLKAVELLSNWPNLHALSFCELLLDILNCGKI